MDISEDAQHNTQNKARIYKISYHKFPQSLEATRLDDKMF